jgi:hypothetical protein
MHAQYLILFTHFGTVWRRTKTPNVRFYGVNLPKLTKRSINIQMVNYQKITLFCIFCLDLLYLEDTKGNLAKREMLLNKSTFNSLYSLY